MSVYGEIVRLTGLRDRIRTKLISLGLIASQNRDNADLEDCKDAIESINEYTPYLMTQAGIQDVAGFKYAQIDQSAWVPAGTTPSGLCSVLTELGANGIERTPLTHSQSIGTVYPPSNYQGMYANQLNIDTDVIKPENIKAGVQILGVTGTYSGSFGYGQNTSPSTYAGQSVVFTLTVPFSRIKTMYIQSTDSVQYSSGQIRTMYVPLPTTDNLAVLYSYGSGNTASGTCTFTVTQMSASSWEIHISPPSIGNFIGNYNLVYTYL